MGLKRIKAMYQNHTLCGNIKNVQAEVPQLMSPWQLVL